MLEFTSFFALFLFWYAVQCMEGVVDRGGSYSPDSTKETPLDGVSVFTNCFPHSSPNGVFFSEDHHVLGDEETYTRSI